MKIKKKCSKENVSYFVYADSRKIHFENVLQVFDVNNIFVELLDLKDAPSEFESFLHSNMIDYVLKSDIELYINAKLNKDKFEVFFESINQLDYEEMRIWNCSTKDADSLLSPFTPFFYIDYMGNQSSFEIICDRAFDKENAEQSLCDVLSDKKSNHCFFIR